MTVEHRDNSSLRSGDRSVAFLPSNKRRKFELHTFVRIGQAEGLSGSVTWQGTDNGLP
jgi:hypothetical protein